MSRIGTPDLNQGRLDKESLLDVANESPGRQEMRLFRLADTRADSSQQVTTLGTVASVFLFVRILGRIVKR